MEINFWVLCGLLLVERSGFGQRRVQYIFTFTGLICRIWPEYFSPSYIFWMQPEFRGKATNYSHQNILVGHQCTWRWRFLFVNPFSQLMSSISGVTKYLILKRLPQEFLGVVSQVSRHLLMPFWASTLSRRRELDLKYQLGNHNQESMVGSKNVQM